MQRDSGPDVQALDDRVEGEQVDAHYAQIPAMAIAPVGGGLFAAWVLWDAVNNRYLAIGMGIVIGLSALRLGLYAHYARLAPKQRRAPAWRAIAVGASLVSGCVWGSAAPFLYPPQQQEYAVFLVILLTLLPIVPVAALAAYMPAFYAYYFPCLAPLVVVLVQRPTRAEHFAALLLLLMMLAMLAFARRYSASLAEAIRLRLALAAKSEALAAANEQKTRLIAAASHDLRQPVHAMGLFLETLRERDDDRIAQAVSRLDASQKSLRGMLGNMLDISRLDVGQVEPRFQSVALGELMRRLREEFAPQAAHKGLALRCRPLDVAVWSDPVLLERIVRNLLSNAINYTARGGILLACRRRAGGVMLQVVDTGVGIAAEQIDAVFDAFGRPAAAVRSSAQGLGLGLAIVKQTAELLRHRLQLRSVPGRGSAFSLGMALATAAAAPASRSDRLPPMPAGTVMIVDDDENVREATALLLGQWGLQCRGFASVAQAVARLERGERVPDLLLLDYRSVPGESTPVGVDAIRQRSGREVPVILITGDTAPSRIREAYEAGFFLLHKPVDPGRLRACVAELLGQRAANSATKI